MTDAEEYCHHLDQVQEVSPSADGCEDCLRTGGQWVHLRMCMICGHVGCCDNSPGRHATAHFDEEGHPLIQSFEPGEAWWWCYVDEFAFEVNHGEPVVSGDRAAGTGALSRLGQGLDVIVQRHLPE